MEKERTVIVFQISNSGRIKEFINRYGFNNC